MQAQPALRKWLMATAREYETFLKQDSARRERWVEARAQVILELTHSRIDYEGKKGAQPNFANCEVNLSQSRIIKSHEDF